MNPKVTTAVERAPRKQQPVTLRQASLLLTDEPLRVTESGHLSVVRDERADPNEVALLVFDPAVRAFRAVLLPPGRAWELVEKQQGPQLWTPRRTA